MKAKFALVCFYTDDKKILLQNRKSINKRNSEWGFFGGHIEGIESDLEAILREVKEELNIDMKENDLIYLGTVISPVNVVYSSIFLSKLSFDIRKVDVLEGDGCQLFSEKECNKLKLHPGDRFRKNLIFNYLKLKE